MLVDSHTPVDLFALVPDGLLGFEPELEVLDRLLEDDLLFERVRADLLQRYPKTSTRGRKSTPVEVILRMLVASASMGGAMRKSRSSSPTAKSCASSAGSIWNRCRTIPR